MNTIHIIFFIFAFLSSFTFHAISSANDFCVADLSLPKTLTGYSCKPEANVTVDDFVFSGLVKGKPVAPFKSGLTVATVENLPGLNGLDIAATRLDMGVNGFVPMHYHPESSELLIIVKGEVIVGFITPEKKAYVKTLKASDVIVLPKGLLHFVINSGVGKALIYGVFSSSSPTVHVADFLLFGNDLSTSIIAKTTLLDVSQIKKLKAVFGGSG